MDYKALFIFDPLSKLVGSFVILFTVLIFIYSLGFIRKARVQYYFWFFLTALVSLCAVFSNHLMLIVIFWGFLGLTLFQLINIYSNEAVATVAKKTFIIVGGTDGFLLFGFLLYAYMTSHLYITGGAIPVASGLALLSFLSIAIGCFAKAGCMPFHTWIPEVAEAAPIPVVAYLPASLDKLLGIYLLTRIVKDTFILDNFSKAVLLCLGSLTIIAAVMMALVQHNIKKLLGYHAVSQVGYMVLGIACASPLGLAAGLFHMVNHAIYKSCLFLGAGNVETKTETAELKHLGGLAKYMPITFIVMLIASFSISGIPPFNGFVSKWMIYQALINFMNITISPRLKLIIMLALISALVGSSLTIASFLKLNAGVFLGSVKKTTREASLLLLFSGLVLALLCILFGMFASSLILPFIEKSVGTFHLTGLWNPTLATGLMALGAAFGFIIYLLTRKPRISPSFVGGENLTAQEEVKIEDFYSTIRELKAFNGIYALAEKKFFDIYEQLKKLSFLVTGFLRYLHNGILPTYLVWCLLGLIGLFFIYFR